MKSVTCGICCFQSGLKALHKWKNKIEKLKGKFSLQNLCRIANQIVFYLMSQKRG